LESFGGLRDKLDVPERVRKKAKGNLSFIGGLPEPIKGGEDGDILYYSCQERAEVSI
jgi:hypothetical protein